MSNPAYEPRQSEKGRYKRTCPECKEKFRTNNPRTKYCSETCKRTKANRAYYEKNSEKIIEKVIERHKSNDSAQN